VNILASYSYLEKISDRSFYPCISVHVRRGDKSLEVEPTPIGEYVDTVRKIADAFNGKWSILLLTDDNAVKKEFIDQLSNQFPIYEVNTSATRYIKNSCNGTESSK
jgi:hypothetical protein